MIFFLINNRLVVLLKCTKIDERLCFKTKILETCGYNSHISNYLIDSSPNNCKVIFYTLNSTFGNLFNNGVEHIVTMNYLTTLHFNEYDIELDDIFKNELTALLKPRMSEKCMVAYLQSLRAALIKSDTEVEKFISLHKLPFDKHSKQKEMNEIIEAVRNLSDERINLIEKIFAENSLNYSISPNIFNYHKNQNIQQNALSIKQSVANNDSQTSAVVLKNYVYIRSCEPHLNLLPGYTYVTENTTYYIIELLTDLKTLVNLITKNLITCFKKFESNDIFNFKLHAYIRKDVYPDLSTLQIKHKLIQYSILNQNSPHIPSDVKFYNKIQTSQWQSGFPNLLRAIVFSQETLITNSKTFEIYGVFCEDVLKTMIKKYGPVIRIRRSINTGKKMFYYAHITLNFLYKSILDEDIPFYGERQCVSLKECSTFIEAHQARRKCCTIIYHTHFRWFHKAIKDVDLLKIINKYPNNDFTNNVDPLFKNIPLLKAMVMNLVHYNYIFQTNDINIYPESTEDQMTMGQIIIESLKGARSLILPWVEAVMKNKKKIFSSLTMKNSPFDGLYDGPLINATSIRTCEKMSDPENHGKQWGCNILNISMLLNNPEFRGIESKNNCIKF